MLQTHFTTGARAKQVPTPCNTWVDRTEPDLDHEGQSSALTARSGSVLVDYLRFRLEDSPEVWRGLSDWLGEMTTRAHGWRAWYDKSAHVLDGGIIASCSDPERAEVEGVLVDLPGKACACLGDKLVGFMRWCLAHGKATRVDYAIDDHRDRITLDRIREAEASGGLVTRWQGMNVIENRRRGELTGWTVYLGSRSSQGFMRFYDKAGEQRHKGNAAAGSWVRCELETKSKLADALAREVLRIGSRAVIEQINRRLRFTEPTGDDSNKRRWAPAQWWASFIGSIRPGPSLLCGEKVEVTISRMAAWVEKQAGPALATLLMADGGDLARLVGILRRSGRRMQSRHYAALAAAGVN